MLPTAKLSPPSTGSPMAQTDRSHEGRLSAVESAVASMGREMHGFRTDFRTFAAEMREEVGSRSRTQWSPIIAAVAVVVAVVGGLAAGPISDIGRIEERQTRMLGNRFTDADGARHGRRLDRLEELVVTVTDEDFDRPEAEAMRVEVMGEVRWIRDQLMEHLCNGFGEHGK